MKNVEHRESNIEIENEPISNDNPIPKQLQREDLRFIRLGKNSKKPVDGAWNIPNSDVQYKFNDKVLLDWLKEGGNYGVLCGYEGLVVIDTDKEGKELHDYIEQHFPKTLTIKTWSAEEWKKHYYFRNKNTKLTNLETVDKDGKTTHYGEIRSINPKNNTYTQVVAAGSHVIDAEEGLEGDYRVINELNIVNLDDELLEELKKKFVSKEILRAEKIKRDTIKFGDGDIENNLNLINLIDTSKLKEVREGYFVGSHPIHGSTTGTNFHVDCKRNIWYCFRGGSHGGGGIASWIAVKDGLIDCSEAVKKLDGETYKKVLKLAEIKYRFVPKSTEQPIRIEKTEIKNNESKEVKEGKDKGLPELILPREGKLISEFAREISNVLKDKNTLFYRIDAKEIVEVGKIKLHKTGEDFYYGFEYIKPNRFITLAESYITPVIQRWDAITKEWVNIGKSMSAELANTLLASYILKQALPQIRRIFTIPIPILYDGELVFPKKGYDERFESWLPYDAPEIIKPKMELSEAKRIIEEIFEEFCFDVDKNHNKINAIAGLLTPSLRGLFPSFNTRTPIGFYLGNKQGVGKDYCAGINGIVYEGQVIEETPISSSENPKNNNNSEELRKKITSYFLQGRKRIHFSNNKGFINNVVLESLATNPYFSDRKLGGNENLIFPNELDISLSGNIGVTYTPDFGRRIRVIKFFSELEDINEKKFKKPNLHKWVLDNRELILSALFCLIRNWAEKGSPKGTKPFTSYPEWADICGGIMEAAGYDSPCEPDSESFVGGDVETTEMKKLFELCYEEYPDKLITKEEIRNVIIHSEEDIFGDLELEDYYNRSGRIKFGIRLSRYKDRVFSGIQMQVDVEDRVSTKQKMKFTKIIKTPIQTTLEDTNNG